MYQEASLTEGQSDQFNKSAILVLILVVAISVTPRLIVGTLQSGRNIDLRYEDFLIIAVAYLWLLALFSGRKIIIDTPISKVLFLYLFFASMSTILGIFMGWINLSQALLFFFKEIEYFLLFFIVINMVKTKKDIAAVVWALIILGFANNIYGLAQIITGQLHGYYGIALIGESSPFGIGEYMAMIFFLSITLLTYGKIRSVFLRIFLLINALLSILNLTFSLSRAAGIGAIAVFILFLLFRKGKKQLPVIIIVTAILIAIGVNQSVYQFFKTKTGAPGQSRISSEALERGKNVRMEYYFKPVIRKSMESPIFGFGKSITGTEDVPLEVHNYYLRILLEMGVFGLILFLFLIYLVMKTALGIYRSSSDPPLLALAMACFLITVALLVAALLQDTFTSVKVSEFYWIIVGLTMVAYRIFNEDLKCQRGGHAKNGV